MTARAILALIFCSLTFAATSCGSADDETPSGGDPQLSVVEQAVQSVAAKTVKVPKPPKVKCEPGAKPKPPLKAGAPCGVCGQTIQCDGSCGGVGVPAEYGQECGCGNTWQCNGTCGGGPAIPAQYGQDCGCGNTVQCSGQCSGGQAIPAEYGQPCGCGGTVQCSGTCSIPCPV